VIPAPFEYLRPTSVEQALALLRTYGEEARLLAGGHSLIPLLKMRLATPRYLIDIGRLRDLAYVRAEGDTICIGALTTHTEVEHSELLRAQLPLLASAAASIGDVQVRNCGTIGGSLAHAHPAADFPASLLALDAALVLEGPAGRRVVRATEFFVGMFTTALTAEELLVEVRIPPLPDGSGGAYVKAEDKASHFAVVGVAALVGVRADGTCTRARIGVTGLGATPFRAKIVEAALADSHLDLFASGEYRAHLTRVYAARAVLKAAAWAVPANGGRSPIASAGSRPSQA
jgi:carbon-monoxide dehydrogenase medium subunit